MADVSAVNNQSFAYAGASKSRNTGELGKEDFLKLLSVQLKYQDPLNPDNSTEFIAQLAQFSSLEGMTNLQDSFAGVQAYTLMGKGVIEVDKLTLEETKGLVVGVKFVDGKHQLKVDTGQEIVDIKLENVSEVLEPIKG